jgi:hypothetical protein
LLPSGSIVYTVSTMYIVYEVRPKVRLQIMKEKKKDGSAVAVVIAATSIRGFITEQLPPQV